MADEERPWYMAQDAEPAQAPQPDLAAAAGGYSSPEGESSLLNSLAGAAPAPAGGNAGALMLPLLMAQMQQRQQVSPLGAFANAYAAAQGRPSPILAPQAPSQYQQFQMIHELMKDQALEKERSARLGILNQAQQRLADEAERRRIKDIDTQSRAQANLQWNESKKMFASDDPLIRLIGAKQYVEAGKKLGFDYGPDEEAAIAAFAKGQVTHKQLTENSLDAARGVDVSGRAGMTPEVMSAINRPNGLVAQLAQIDQIDLRTKAADANLKEAQVVEHQNPEFFKARPEVIEAVQQAARGMFNTTYEKLEPNQKQAAMKSGILAAQQQKLAEYKAQQDIAFQKQAALIGLHEKSQINVARAEGKGMFAPAFMQQGVIWVDPKQNGMPIQGDDLLKTAEQLGKEGKVALTQKQAEIANGFERAKAELENMKGIWQKMVDRNLFSGQGDWWIRKGPLATPSAAVENFVKGTVAPNLSPTDSDRAILRSLDASKTKLINIDRQLGTLGVKAFGAYGPELNTLSPTIGKEGMQWSLSQVEDALDAQAKVQKVPGIYGQQRVWAPPILKGDKQPPATSASARPDLSKPPASRATLAIFEARARAKYPPEEAMQKINEFIQMHRITD